MKYLPIKIKEVKEYIGYYEEWYNTFDKDGYKYVIEQLNFDNKYYDDILSSLHNFVKGGKFYPIKVKWVSCKNTTVAKMQQSIFRIKKCLTQDIVCDILRTKFSWPIVCYPIVS